MILFGGIFDAIYAEGTLHLNKSNRNLYFIHWYSIAIYVIEIFRRNFHHKRKTNSARQITQF
jgi:hypothetical protein